MPNTTTNTYRAFFSELEKIAVDWGTARNVAIGAALGGYSGSKVDAEQHGRRNAALGAVFGGVLGAGARKGVTKIHTQLRDLHEVPRFQTLGEHVQKYQPFYEGAAAAKGGLKAGATIGLGTWAGKKLGLIGKDSLPEKAAGIMPPADFESITKVPGSAIPRGPRVRAGGRVGSTTATPFSGNKTKIAGWGHAALGAGAVVGGGMIAHRALKRPLYDTFGDHAGSSTRYEAPANTSMAVGSPSLQAIKHLRQKRQFAQQSRLVENPYGGGQGAY